jgi:hypothetical protein
MTYIRPACLALVLLATPASAQTWVYEPDSPGPAYRSRAYDPYAYEPPSYGTRTVVAGQPLDLPPAQRTTVYRTIIPQGRGRGPIVREKIVTEPVVPAPVVRERVVTTAPAADYAYGVGTRVSDAYALAPLPRATVAAVPAVRSYRYMVINRRLLLVDPATGIVVADLTE